jgi:RND family efflux transporter MFP subunit
MRSIIKSALVGVVIVGIAAGAYVKFGSQGDANAGRPRNPVQTVRTALAEKRTIPIIVQANGYVSPLKTVDVRPQVQSVVREIHVKEGQDVRVGQLLFTLDDRSDASNLEKAKAQVARDRADLADAELTYKRNQELLAKGFVSQSVVDSARNKVDSLRATLQADQANMQAGAVALGYNRVTAGIAGRIGVINVHVGSLAQPSAPLVTIAQLDPVAVTFSVAEKELANITASYPNGGAPVVAQLSNGKEVQGRLIFIDNAVDQQTGTIRMKAQFSNADYALWPGAFVNVRLVSRTLPDAVVVPSQAIVTGPTDQFVYVVLPDSTVKMQKVAVNAIENGQAAIVGVAPGAKVVVEGAQNLRPNGKVKESEAASVKTGSVGAEVGKTDDKNKNMKGAI